MHTAVTGHRSPTMSEGVTRTGPAVAAPTAEPSVMVRAVPAQGRRLTNGIVAATHQAANLARSVR